VIVSDIQSVCPVVVELTKVCIRWQQLCVSTVNVILTSDIYFNVDYMLYAKKTVFVLLDWLRFASRFNRPFFCG